MKQFACGDVVPGCTRTFTGTDSDILRAVAAHAHSDHGLNSIPDTLIAQVRGHIVPAR